MTPEPNRPDPHIAPPWGMAPHPENAGDFDSLENARTHRIVSLMEAEANRSSTWSQNLMILIVSVVAFAALSRWQNDWSWTAVLIAVLFVHELGHLVAMRVCGYRNTKILFIPLFGAAASGINFNVPGWKRVVVALAGPIPGMMIGFAVGIAGLVLNQPYLVRFGEVSCFLNAFNLIPIMPFDGGWVAFYVLFCRHPWLNVAFRACGAALLIWGAVALKDFMLGAFGGLTLLGAVHAMSIATVARRLHKEGFVPAPETLAEIDRGVAYRVADEVRRVFASKGSPDQHLTAAAIEVYSLMHARPPGWLGSFAFTSIHFLGFVLGVVGAIAFYQASRGRDKPANPPAKVAMLAVSMVPSSR